MWFCTDIPNVIRIGQSATWLWRYVDFPRWRSYRCKSTSAFRFYDVSHLGRQRTIFILNFDQIAQFTAEILLLPLPKSKLSPYWNSTSGFHIDLFAAVGMWFGTSLPNFVQIRWSPTELRRHRFYKMAAIASQIYFRFVLWPCSVLRWTKAIGVPNFD